MFRGEFDQVLAHCSKDLLRSPGFFNKFVATLLEINRHPGHEVRPEVEEEYAKTSPAYQVALAVMLAIDTALSRK